MWEDQPRGEGVGANSEMNTNGDACTARRLTHSTHSKEQPSVLDAIMCGSLSLGAAGWRSTRKRCTPSPECTRNGIGDGGTQCRHALCANGHLFGERAEAPRGCEQHCCTYAPACGGLDLLTEAENSTLLASIFKPPCVCDGRREMSSATSMPLTTLPNTAKPAL